MKHPTHSVHLQHISALTPDPLTGGATAKRHMGHQHPKGCASDEVPLFGWSTQKSPLEHPSSGMTVDQSRIHLDCNSS